MSFGALHSGSFLATGICNVDSSRFVAAPRDKRKEGWTETWGTDKNDDLDETSWEIDDEQVGQMLSTPYPPIPLVLTQYRPAWLEQVVLRFAHIPHIVLNSNHLANEATGPLPYLRDHQEASKPPTLVGRQHPSNIAPKDQPCGSSVLGYLKANRGVDLDTTLRTDEQRSVSTCFLNLIEVELTALLLYLRFEDTSAWEQVYRNQYFKASSPQSSNFFSKLSGRFHAWMDRVINRRRLFEWGQKMTIEHATDRARKAYHALEHQLAKHNKLYLVGNAAPSFVDAALWAHLADAMCDVNLVVLLADFPRLVKYFQQIHEMYFTGKIYKWDEWNQRQNLINGFYQLPLSGGKSAGTSDYQDAIDLMQSLSLRKGELQEVLDTVKAKRSGEPWPSTPLSTESNLYRWSMGEDLSAKPEDPSLDPLNNPMRKKMMRDQQRNDQMWISGVALVSAVAIFLLQGGSPKDK